MTVGAGHGKRPLHLRIPISVRTPAGLLAIWGASWRVVTLLGMTALGTACSADGQSPETPPSATSSTPGAPASVSVEASPVTAGVSTPPSPSDRAAAVFAASLPSHLRGLVAADEGLRFNTALALIDAKTEGLDDALTALGEQPALAAAAGSREALDYVRWARTGRRPALPSPAAHEQPGLILISIDTLRADHLGCYGHDRATSPAIDRLASRGARFARARSPAPWTLPTHMSMFTSLNPSFHKLERGGRTGNIRLDATETTLAELLSAGGYHTAGLVAHPFLDASWGFDRGFHLYLRSHDDASGQVERSIAWLEWHRFHARASVVPTPFFLFLHIIDPHEPYDAPPAFQKRFVGTYDGELRPRDHLVSRFQREELTDKDLRYVLSLYDADINYVDSSLERLFRALETAGLMNSTLTVLTSDHGEEFKDHGRMGHKWTLYGELLHVPLTMSWPDEIPPDMVIDAPVSVLDILPTMLEVAGLQTPPIAQGISLGPYLGLQTASAAAPPANRVLFGELGPLGASWERDFHRRSIETADWKLILSYGPDNSIQRELYNLRQDPGEQRNLHASHPSTAAIQELELQLSEFIRAGLAHNPEFHQRNNMEMGDEVRESLRSLGYID